MRPALFASANLPTPDVVIKTPVIVVFDQVLFDRQ